MTATISRNRRGTSADNSNGGRQTVDSVENKSDSVVAGLGFNVTVGEVPTPKRAGRTATVQIPQEVEDAFFRMLQDNPERDEKSMAHVGPITITNQQLTQWLVGGVAKWSKRLPDGMDADYVKSSINVTEGKRSALADDKDKKVTLIWTVRKLSDAEVTAKRAAKAAKAS